MTKQLHAKANATIALAVAALAAASRSLMSSLAARPEHWTVDDRSPRSDRAARWDNFDRSESCIAMCPRIVEPVERTTAPREPERSGLLIADQPERESVTIIDPGGDDMTRTGRFRRIARGTPNGILATQEPVVTPTGSRRRFESPTAMHAGFEIERLVISAARR